MQRQCEYSHPVCLSTDGHEANLQDAKTETYFFSYPK